MLIQNSKLNFLNSIELAEYLNVKPQTIRLWCMNHSLPFFKLNGTAVRFKKDEIDKWIEEQRINGGIK